MIGHLHGLLTTGSRNGLGRTRFGGFFMGAGKVWLRDVHLAAIFYGRSSFAAARSVMSARNCNEPAARLRASSSTLAGAVSGLPA